LPEIIKAHTLYVEILSSFPSYFTKNDCELKIKEIILFIDLHDDDEVVIESNDIRYSYWAELVAARIRCKHFLYALEAFFPYKHTNNQYLRFKLNRKELAGTRESSLYNLLGTDIVNKENNLYFVIVSSNMPADIPPPIKVQWSDYDFKICYLGRETKPFFKNASQEILEFAKKHKDKKVLYLCLGCIGESPICMNLKYASNNLTNVSAVFTGRLFPLPKTYFDHIDLLIGSSGCAGVGARMGVKTIKYLDDGKTPLGVLGYDIKDRRSEQKIYPGNLTQLLEDVYFSHYLEKHHFTNLYIDYSKPTWKESPGFETIISPTEPVYYDTTTIRQVGIKGLLYKFLKVRSMQQRLKQAGQNY
jgi:hypothetical protein